MVGYNPDETWQQRDVAYFESCISTLRALSTHAKVFCLVHKMDLVDAEQREAVFESYVSRLQMAAGGGPGETRPRLGCFKTSIWDETLFSAWSCIVAELVPDVQALRKIPLTHVAEVCDADEIVVFERGTYLVISHATRPSLPQISVNDTHRFEKLSNIIKQFKLSCMKMRSSVKTMTVQNANFTALLEQFTPNTVVLVVLRTKHVSEALTRVNLAACRDELSQLQAQAPALFTQNL